MYCILFHRKDHRWQPLYNYTGAYCKKCGRKWKHKSAGKMTWWKLKTNYGWWRHWDDKWWSYLSGKNNRCYRYFRGDALIRTLLTDVIDPIRRIIRMERSD